MLIIQHVAVTRMEEWLKNKDKEQILGSYGGPSPLWADSTVSKHNWVMNLYAPFAKLLDVPAFPLTEQSLIPFIRTLALGVRYKIDSIKVCFFYSCSQGITLICPVHVQCIVIPSLKRLNYLETGSMISQELHIKISSLLKELRSKLLVLLSCLFFFSFLVFDLRFFKYNRQVNARKGKSQPF